MKAAAQVLPSSAASARGRSPSPRNPSGPARNQSHDDPPFYPRHPECDCGRHASSVSHGGRDKAGDGDLADLPSPANFTIPMPPSTNHLFKNVKGVGRVKTKTYDDFTMMAVAAIRQQRVKPIAGYVVMLFAFELASSQADVSNRIKAAEDAIVKAGVIEDDRFVTAMMITKVPAANGLAHVKIYPIQSLKLDFHASHNGASGALIVTAPCSTGDHDGDQPQ